MNSAFLLGQITVVSASTDGAISFDPGAVLTPLLFALIACLVTSVSLCVVWISARHLFTVLRTPALGGVSDSGFGYATANDSPQEVAALASIRGKPTLERDPSGDVFLWHNGSVRKTSIGDNKPNSMFAAESGDKVASANFNRMHAAGSDNPHWKGLNPLADADHDSPF